MRTSILPEVARLALFGVALFCLSATARGEDAKPETLEVLGSDGEAPAALPAEVDLRPELDRLGLGPRRQGRRNTCSVFTTAAVFEFALAKHRGEGAPLSVEYLNWACNQVIGNKTQDRGQFFHHLLKAYDQYGICTEDDMPYRRRFDPELEPSESAKEKAKTMLQTPFQVRWIKRIRPSARLSEAQFAEIKQTLAKGWPVAAGASHSRTLVGYKDDDTQPGGGIFYTKDSGNGRYSQVTYEFAMKELNDAFWVEVAAE